MPLTDGPVTMLVVDDEESIRNALRKFLTQQGYEVVTAAGGEEALAVLQRQKITGMLLDVNLPGITGVELVPQIMELEPAIALLMLTAVNDATSAALCMQRGAFDYLIKPIDLGHLGRAIHQALRRRHTQLEGQQINQWLKDEVARPGWRSGGWNRPTRSEFRSPRWRRWSTPSRPRTLTSGATRPGWPTCRPW